MKFTLQVYNELKQKVSFLYQKLNLNKYEKTKGRKLAVSIQDTIALALCKQTQGIPTKKSIWKDFRNFLKCSCKTLVVNMNEQALLAFRLLNIILAVNRKHSHLVKHTDSTDIPVCLNKNSKNHKTMNELADWGYSGKGMFYGLKLHIASDLNRKLLSFSFTSGNAGDISQFMKLNKGMNGIFVADSGYVSEYLEREFYQEHKRILFAKPKKNMKKLMTLFQRKLCDTRMTVEINFRNLKTLYAFIASFPRSIDGYLANCIYSLTAFVLRWFCNGILFRI